jgi:UDP-2,4-diacetamido-2,4,6-trideoxy-beta-L-altropyranose hydrolase
MNIVVRADASSWIGHGHVMRCLTIADALRDRGNSVEFVTRPHHGNLNDLIEQRGFKVRPLPAADSSLLTRSAPPDATWLGGTPDEDADQTIAILTSADVQPRWLIVDHYAIDRAWEERVRAFTERILVIDDLANRPHDCDALLDQNIENPTHRRYLSLVPAHARLLLGTEYALVRPEFAERRAEALARRDGRRERLLVSMGGADPGNDTEGALDGLAEVRGVEAVDVVIGAGNPHESEIRARCRELPKATLHVQTSEMATLMTRADISITAGGSTTWERCVLGLPGVVVIQSADQVAIAAAVEAQGAQRVIGRSGSLAPADYAQAVASLTPDNLVGISRRAASLCDGRGAMRIADFLMS